MSDIKDHQEEVVLSNLSNQPNINHELSHESNYESNTDDLIHNNFNRVLDINIKLAIEVGNTNISIRNLLQLNQGSIVELNKLAGEPLDVLANGTLIAHGEIVVINDKFGIRLTDIISPEERHKNIN